LKRSEIKIHAFADAVLEVLSAGRSVALEPLDHELGLHRFLLHRGIAVA